MHQTVDDWKKKSPFRACHLFKCKLVSFREGIQYTFFSKGNVVIKYLIGGGVVPKYLIRFSFHFLIFSWLRWHYGPPSCRFCFECLPQVREMGMTGGAGFLLDRPTYRAPETFLSLPEDTRSWKGVHDSFTKNSDPTGGEAWLCCQAKFCCPIWGQQNEELKLRTLNSNQWNWK